MEIIDFDTGGPPSELRFYVRKTVHNQYRFAPLVVSKGIQDHYGHVMQIALSNGEEPFQKLVYIIEHIRYESLMKVFWFLDISRNEPNVGWQLLLR